MAEWSKALRSMGKVTGPNPESKVFDSRIWTLVDDKIEWMLLDIRVTSGSSLH